MAKTKGSSSKDRSNSDLSNKDLSDEGRPADEAVEPSHFEVRDRRRFNAEPGATDERAEAPVPGSTGTAAETAEAAAAAPSDTAPPTAGEAKAPGAAAQAGEPASETTREPAGASAGSDEGGAEHEHGTDGEEFQMPEITSASLIQFTMASLAQQAWCDLGLVASPRTGKVEPRLPEARLAIDAVAALLPVIAPRLDDASRRDTQTLLSNLRLNYVEQLKRQSS